MKKRSFDFEFLMGRFMDLSHTAQYTYVYLSAFADDDGFVACPLRVLRTIGAESSALDELVDKGFVIVFENYLVAVLVDWNKNNYLRADRYKPTNFQKYKEKLDLDNNMRYVTVVKKTIITNEKEVTKPKLNPSHDEVVAFHKEQKFKFDVEAFFNYYQTRGWTTSTGHRIRDWKAAMNMWDIRENKSQKKKSLIGGRDMKRRAYSDEELASLINILDEEKD